MKKRGFRFVGPTTMYALMQSVGMVNDHTVDCFRWKQLGGGRKRRRYGARRPIPSRPRGPAIRTLSRMAPTFSVIGIVVADMATSLAFYRQLGLDIPADADDATARRGGAARRPPARVGHDGHDPLVRRVVDAAVGRPPRRPRVRVRHARPTSTRPTDDAGRRRARTSHLAPWDAFWGQRYAVVLDPDGNHVDLFAPLPTSAHELR